MFLVMVRAAAFVLLLTAGCGGDDGDGAFDGGPDAEHRADAGADAGAPDAGAGCRPSEPALFSTFSPTKDEDPSVLRARDGTLYLAWFSDRGGNPDLYVATTVDCGAWSEPIRITTDTGGDFYPNLIQSADGTFHLVWFRWVALFEGSIWYSHSADGVSWDEADEVQVTTEIEVDDWVPTLAETADGTLVIAFVSSVRSGGNSDIFVVRRPAGATAWEPPAAPAGINSMAHHDHLPFVARTGDGLSMVWMRYALGDVLPWTTPKADLWLARSSDGLSWSAPEGITDDTGDVVHAFPAIYPTLAGEPMLLWATTRGGGLAAVEMPLAEAGAYPTGLVSRPELTGYSPRIAATATPGVSAGAWVQGPEGAQDVYVRYFAP